MGALTSKPFAFTARPWELRGAEAVDLAGGEGSPLRLQIRGGKILRILPFTVGSEEWITDAARFSYDGLDRQRLDQPHLFGASSNWSLLFRIFVAQVFQAPRRLSFYVGPEQNLQTILLVRTLTTLLPNYTLSVVGSEGANLASFFPFTSSDQDWIERSSVYLLIGLNLRFENPILFARLRRQLLLNSSKRVLLFAASGFGFPVDQVINLGLNLSRFVSILRGSDHVCRPFLLESTSVLVGRAVDRVMPLFSSALVNWIRRFLPFCFIFPVLPSISAAGFSKIFAPSPFAIGENLPSDDLSVSFDQQLNSCPLAYAGSHVGSTASRASILFPTLHSFEQMGSYFLPSVGLRSLAPGLAPASNSQARPSWTVARALADLIFFVSPFFSSKKPKNTTIGSLQWLLDFIDPVTTSSGVFFVNPSSSFRVLIKFPNLFWPVIGTFPGSSLEDHSPVQVLATALRLGRFRNFYSHG
jgi:NADH dehydrogenase (ubiquinone) Fe-S protein 1